VRLRRIIKLAFGASLFCAILLIAGVIGVGLFLSAPARAVVGAAPADLPVESVSIMSGSGATLRGWFVPGRPGAGAVSARRIYGRSTALRRCGRLFWSRAACSTIAPPSRKRAGCSRAQTSRNACGWSRAPAMSILKASRRTNIAASACLPGRDLAAVTREPRTKTFTTGAYAYCGLLMVPRLLSLRLLPRYTPPSRRREQWPICG